MPHVELSLTDLSDSDLADSDLTEPETSDPAEPEDSTVAVNPTCLRRWSEAVSGAAEPSLLIDSEAVVVAMSPSCQELLGLSEPVTGRALLDGVLRLLDFTSDGAALTDNEVAKIPPLLALSSGRLARGLIRVQCAEGACTLDAIATPIGVSGNMPAGSLTFVSRV